MDKFRIPRAFFDDHRDRDLPTPRVLVENKGSYTISRNDEHLPELINDAEHYANNGTDAPRSLVVAARHLLRALGEWR